tara:strand:+ start:283 stop:771 length:489 start_codon:yes stop_codon:yes gene_type:complete
MKLYEPFKFLTNKECDQIIKYAMESDVKAGTTLRKSKVRNNRISWYKNSERWQGWIDMFNSIDPVIDWIQTPQVAFYTPGEQYKWHVDTWPNYRTHIRHFTLTCELQSAPGARLELKGRQFNLQRGEAIIFKPQDEHRATTPTEGERISFTIWAMALNPAKR